jgi:hypothetical protein
MVTVTFIGRKKNYKTYIRNIESPNTIERNENG